MEIRLAYEQGLLRGRYLNHFQRWALSYWLYMDRRTRNDDVRAIQELQTFELFPERWQALHFGGRNTEVVAGEAHTAVTEYYPSEIDAFLAQVESGGTQQMNTMDLDNYYGMEV